MRYRLRTLLIVLAMGPAVLWAIAVLFDAYRWSETYPGPDPPYLTGRDPLRHLLLALSIVVAAATRVLVVVVTRFIRRLRPPNPVRNTNDPCHSP